MKTLEVNQRKWPELCRRIAETCRGTMVRIERVEPAGARTTIMADVPLQKFVWDDKSNPCNNNLLIETGADGEKPAQHVVVEPIHIRLKNGTNADRYSRVEIIAENGTTIVEFHPGLNPMLIQAFSE
jgi:hypothetical protein